jgi:hypothetical protein
MENIKTFIATIVTRLLIPPYPFRVATLDELCPWLVEVEELAVFFVVEGLRADTVAGEELPLLELLKLSGMQSDSVPQ